MIHIISNGNKISLNSMIELNVNDILKSVLKIDHVMHESFDISKLSPENIKKLKKKLNLMDQLTKKESALIKKTSLTEVKESKNSKKENHDEEQLEKLEGLLLSNQLFFSPTYDNLKKQQLHIIQKSDSINEKIFDKPTSMIKSEFYNPLNKIKNKKIELITHPNGDIKKITSIFVGDKNNSLPLTSNKIESNNSELMEEIIKNKLDFKKEDLLSNDSINYKERIKRKNVNNTLVTKEFIVNRQPIEKNDELEIINKLNNDFLNVRTGNNKNIFSHKGNVKNNFKLIKDGVTLLLQRVINLDIKKELNNKNEKIIDPDAIEFYNIQSIQTPSTVILPKTIDKVLEIPAWKVLQKKVSNTTLPPSIIYVFKQWGSNAHQMQINFIDRQLQLIASTGRVYQSSLDNFNQYQGRLSLALNSDNKSIHWHIGAIDTSTDKENEKE
ncbi:hypothetical protein [Proteus hauseri]|uniref:hypothetical protein n=1 Tax=Proteus hauseri TaxID=183417 RepID=UPI00100952A0|nr:hypothetical protein [Proteus hauseri]QAV22733.1 hypothetical protein PH4a_04990 [Proteus hauseri]